MKSFFRRVTHAYNNLRLQTKLTITHLVIVTIPMAAIMLIFFTRIYDMIVSDTIRNEQEAALQTAPLIESEVSDILSAHDQLTEHAFYQKLIYSARTESLKELSVSEEAEDFQREIHKLTTGSLIGDIRIYLDVPGNESIFSEGSIHSAAEPLDRAYRTYWYGIFAGQPAKSELFCPAFYLSTYEAQNYGDIAYISKNRTIYNGDWVTVYLAIYFSTDHLRDTLADNLSSNSSVAYIINERESIVATTDLALSGTYHFSYDVVQDSVMSSNNFITKNILGEDVYAGFNRIENTDWYMVVAIPSNPLILKSRIFMGVFVLIYLGCILAAFIIATLLSRSLTNRLAAVIDRMTRCRLGLPCVLPDSTIQDEIGELVDSYNYMTHMIHDLVEEQAKAAEDLRIAEFDSLQAQMNPHFLYNTMEMINWLSLQGRSQEVSLAIQKLSRFYKLTLSRKQSLSTIQDELEHVTIYVELQNMRFDDNIDFIVDMPDELMEHAIPKLTFQPVVENSILHGIMEKEEKKGTIVLTGWQEEHAIVILISDDGVGIAPQELETILSEKKTTAGRSGSNIAIYNTHRRLQLMYGTEYGLKYTSVPGGGTDVEIRTP
ncbi:sensor histidine kinase [bacterium C-53]|nr:sensor histidine kinase [Lachnospiraceae bacterium]NBI02375.1 sensor histidine kinase [Lachnospiraceae bacterium]RKJ11928.1 sensor histidine kinase [bacterium C-53]